MFMGSRKMDLTFTTKQKKSITIIYNNKNISN